MDMPSLSGSLFTWKGQQGTSRLELLGLDDFPREFKVVSHRSGDVRTFLVDNEVNLQNEFFDGEACAYKSDGFKIQIWRG